MAYASFEEGHGLDLHDLVEGGWVCSGCKLTRSTRGVGDNDWRGCIKLHKLEEVQDHVYEHYNQGHYVPEQCFDRILKELQAEGQD